MTISVQASPESGDMLEALCASGARLPILVENLAGHWGVHVLVAGPAHRLEAHAGPADWIPRHLLQVLVTNDATALLALVDNGSVGRRAVGHGAIHLSHTDLDIVTVDLPDTEGRLLLAMPAGHPWQEADLDVAVKALSRAFEHQMGDAETPVDRAFAAALGGSATAIPRLPMPARVVATHSLTRLAGPFLARASTPDEDFALASPDWRPPVAQVAAGVSAVVETSDQLAAARMEARSALATADARECVFFDRAEARCWVAAMGLAMQAQQQPRSAALERLRESDKHNRAQLEATVRAYLQTDLNLHQAAQAMHVHINTMRYRLRRAEEVSGLTLRRGTDVMALWTQLSLAGPQ